MADPIPPESKADPTYKKYNLTCKIKFFDKSVRDEVKPGVFQQYQRRLVLLVPVECDETHRFYHAWVPSSPKEHFELEAVIGSPVNSPCRLAVFMGHDGRCDRPYLFVMTKAIEDIIVKMAEDRTIRVTTQPANINDSADDVQVSEGNYDPI